MASSSGAGAGTSGTSSANNSSNNNPNASTSAQTYPQPQPRQQHPPQTQATRQQQQRTQQIDVDVDVPATHQQHHQHHIPSIPSSSSAPSSLSATPASASSSSKHHLHQEHGRTRMPAIGTPAFYDPDAAPTHPTPSIDYATFMMQQQQQAQAQAQQQAAGQMGYGPPQGEYAAAAAMEGSYGGYDPLEMGGMVGVFGYHQDPHQHPQQHQQQQQQAFAHPSAHAHHPHQQQHAHASHPSHAHPHPHAQTHGLHHHHHHPQHPHHQFSSVSPTSASSHTLPSLPSASGVGGGSSGPGGPGPGPGGAGPTTPGAAQHQQGFYYDQHHQLPGQQFGPGLPEHAAFEMYFPGPPPPTSGSSGGTGGTGGGGTGFDSFPSSASTGAGTPPVPMWVGAGGSGMTSDAAAAAAAMGEMSGQSQSQMPAQGQAQMSTSVSAGGGGGGGSQKRSGRSGTVRASQQPQGRPPTVVTPQKGSLPTQSQSQIQAQARTPTGSGQKLARSSGGPRKRAKRTRVANDDGSEGSEDDSGDDDDVGVGAAFSTSQTGGGMRFGTSFPSWSSGMGGSIPAAHGFGAGGVGGGTGGVGGGGGNWTGVPGLAGLVGVSGQNARLPGACTHCKKLKMKCEFPQGENVCKRCKAGGHACVVEGRKPRSAPNKREYLLAQIRQKDAIIESLLKQLHNPYMATPLSIAAYRMASSPSDAQGSRNVIQWLERLQQSAQNQAGAGAGGRAARQLERHAQRKQAGMDADDGSESDGDVDELEHDPADGVDAASLMPPKLEGDATVVSETLKQNDSLPDDAVPIGLLANLSISNHKGRTKERSRTRSEHSTGRAASAMGSAKDLESEDDDDTNVGVANETYFLPGPASDLHVRKMLIERHSPPEILVHGLVNAEDVEKLFEIFYEKVNPFLSLLDPVLHTPASTFARCPFLFTVICAISSRYYREKAEIYAIAMHFAKHAAATALIDGWKSVELCQAYILMAVYAVPARRWEEDRSWLYIGLAIRLATDLNLHQASSTKPTSEQHEREILNRTRVWMICFNLDRSTATQFGKPSTIKEDYKQISIIRNSKDWYKRSKYNHPYDIHLCAYSSLLRIVAAFHEEIYSDKDSPSGLNQNSDFREIIQRHDVILEDYFAEWTQKFNDDSDPEDPGCKFRCTLLPFLTNYSRLVMYSFGFQQAFRRGFQQGDELFFNKCMESASNVIKCVIDVLAPSGYFRYAPDGHFVFASFASAFLLKLLRPEFSDFVAKEHANQIFALIGKLIQVLASSEVSIDDRHTPKLYARFLAGLLAKHQPGGSSSGRLHPGRPSDNQMPDADGHGGQGPMYPGGGPTQTVFHVNTGTQGGTSPQHGASQRALGAGQHNGMPDLIPHQASAHSPLSMSSTPMDTPIYEAEATYAIGTGPLELSSSDGLQFGFGYGMMPDEEMLAAMHAIKNQTFWDNMMMPGFMWPDTARATPYPQQNGIPGLNSGHMPQQMPLHS